jgi:hypothetical protein
MRLDDVRVLRRLLALTAVLWLALTAAASAADVTADRFDDPAGAGACTAADHDCSLRQAIAFATWGDTIRLGNGSYSVQTGTLMVDKNLTFAGTNRLTSIIDGLGNHNAQNDPVRIMRVLGVTVALNDLSFTNGVDGKDEGFSGCSPCNTILAFGGGALFNDAGSVIIQRVRFYQNLVSPTGGAIGNNGSLSITDADFDGNGATFGGAIYTRGSGTVTLDRVSMRNAGGTQGGGLFNNGSTVTMTNSTVADNGQSNARGGGVVNHAGGLTLRNVTLVGNLRGGLETDGGATTTVQNTILGSSPYQDGAASACVSPNLSSAAGGTSAQPITTSLGNNLSEDTICNLTGSNDHPNDNARMAPATDNGAYAYTAAILHDSPALDGGSDTACSPLDGRMQTRQGTHCDIGAFEAVRIGAPQVITTNALAVTDTHAHLQTSFNLHGESGALHFMWGINPNALINSTETIATGPVGSQLSRAIDLDFLDPETPYYFAAVLDNATGTMTGPTTQFTTSPSPPSVTRTEPGAVTDTSAVLSFWIDPVGRPTSYVIDYGSGRTAPVTIPANAPDQQYTRMLTGLAPATDYTVRVIATSSAGESGPDGATTNLRTVPQVTGAAGAETTVVDRVGSSFSGCPQHVHVNWDDGAEQDFGAAPITCTDLGGGEIAFETRVKHTYAGVGHYHVTFLYDTNYLGETYAAVSAPAPAETATPTPTATASPTPPAVVSQATPTPTPAPAPVFHQTVVVVPSGTVLYKPKGSSKFIPLPPGTVPLGSQIDATKGRVTITSVPRAGAPAESADFYAGIFTITQDGAVTVLTLSGPLPSCGKLGKAAAGKKVKSRKLWGDGKGNFRTQGRYSAATIRGTRWLVEDTCAGTKTTVAVGVVSVRDNVLKKTVVVRAPKSYLAKPKPRR